MCQTLARSWGRVRSVMWGCRCVRAAAPSRLSAGRCGGARAQVTAVRLNLPLARQSPPGLSSIGNASICAAHRAIRELCPTTISASCTVYLAVTPATPRKPLLPTDFIPPDPVGRLVSQVDLCLSAALAIIFITLWYSPTRGEGNEGRKYAEGTDNVAPAVNAGTFPGKSWASCPRDPSSPLRKLRVAQRPACVGVQLQEHPALGVRQLRRLRKAQAAPPRVLLSLRLRRVKALSVHSTRKAQK